MLLDIQNASVFKRIGALLLDLILLTIIATGVMFLVSAVSGFDKQVDHIDAIYQQYAAAHGIETFDITEEQYNKLSQEEKDRYDNAYRALTADEDFLRTYSVTRSLMLVIPSLGIFFAYAILEFAVPLILKNGQTVGKKVFSLGVIRIDGVKATPLMLFVRTLLGKFTVETMIPIMLFVMNGVFGLTGLIVAGLLAVLEIILLAATKHRTVIHDAFAQTVVVDLPSQMVFDTHEELVAYKARLAAEHAADAEYK